MILIADSQCTTAEDVKKHAKDLPSVEDLLEDLRTWKENIDFFRTHPMKFYDYPSMLIPEKKKPLVNADQLIGWDKDVKEAYSGHCKLKENI